MGLYANKVCTIPHVPEAIVHRRLPHVPEAIVHRRRFPIRGAALAVLPTRLYASNLQVVEHTQLGIEKLAFPEQHGHFHFEEGVFGVVVQQRDVHIQPRDGVGDRGVVLDDLHETGGVDLRRGGVRDGGDEGTWDGRR